MANETRQKRIALGLCADCGGPHTGENRIAHTCGPCAQKPQNDSRKWRADHLFTYRAKLKNRYDARRAEGLCTKCGKPRTGRRITSVFCGACAKKQRVLWNDHRQRERNQRWGYTEGDGRNAKKYPVGAASTAKRDGKGWYVSLRLDTPSYDAIQVIHKRYRDAEYKAGRTPLTHQNSRLVREIILRYEHSRAAVQPRKHRLITEWKLNLSLDGRTRAIVQRHADRTFDGNLSATLRAMLIECQGFRRAFTGRGY